MGEISPIRSGKMKWLPKTGSQFSYLFSAGTPSTNYAAIDDAWSDKDETDTIDIGGAAFGGARNRYE
jgi:hypothetical protein